VGGGGGLDEAPGVDTRRWAERGGGRGGALRGGRGGNLRSGLQVGSMLAGKINILERGLETDPDGRVRGARIQFEMRVWRLVQEVDFEWGVGLAHLNTKGTACPVLECGKGGEKITLCRRKEDVSSRKMKQIPVGDD
jgi:hypothetical protein